MAIEKITALDNVARAVENADNITTTMDLNMSNAYEESKQAAEHVEETKKQLDKQAEEIHTPDPEAPVVKTDSIYTKKLSLSEDLNDFKISWDDLSDESDDDDYLDYDMYNFVYGIVTDDWPKPKNPLDHPIRKFQHTGSDDYLKTNSNTGVTQVTTDINGDIVVYSNNPSDFDDVKAVCDHYHITYGDVRSSRSDASHWGYSLKIHVPEVADGYPMMAEDFFAQYGLTMEDVIENHKVGNGKEANWGRTYMKNASRDRKDANNYVNDASVEEIYEKHRNRAGSSNDPLETFIKDMFNELDSKKLTYSKSALKKRFLAEFEDDFED